MSAAVAAVALVGSATACSSNTTPPQQQQPGTSTSPTSAVPTGHGAYAQCLTEHGVPAPAGGALGPQPGGPPPGVDQDTWHTAMQACSSLAPGPPPG